MVSVELIDQPQSAAREGASVRDNGVVTITQGEVDLEDSRLDEPDAKADAPDDEGDAQTPKPITRTLKVATDLEKAKRTLKKLDGEVQTILRELGTAERVAYFTTVTASSAGMAARRRRRIADRLAQESAQAARLQGQDAEHPDGLAEKVPDDADLVAIMGPMTQFQQAEVDALACMSTRAARCSSRRAGDRP